MYLRFEKLAFHHWSRLWTLCDWNAWLEETTKALEIWICVPTSVVSFAKESCKEYRLVLEVIFERPGHIHCQSPTCSFSRTNPALKD